MAQRLTYKLLTLVLFMVALTACSGSEDLVVPGSANQTLIPIRPSVADGIQYDVTATRAVGPIERWSTDSLKWLAANFYTFALRTKNTENDTVDYHKSDVMYNQLMRIQNKNGEIKFYDATGAEEQKYYSRWRAFRYKFFTYFTDDAVLGSLQQSDTRITRPVTITGHQDLIHGMAYHTRQDLDNIIDKMPEGGEKDIFVSGNNGRDYLYSGMAGNRGIHPQFHLNHLLCRFDVSVQGMTGLLDKYGFLRVLVDTVSISAPQTATFTLANDQWDDEDTYKAAIDRQEILAWNESTRKDYFPEILQQDMQGGTYQPTVNYADLQQLLSDNGLLPNHDFHQVATTDAQPLCTPILLPVTTDSVDIRFSYLYVYAHYDEGTQTWILNADDTRNRGRASMNVRLGMPEGRHFTPGRKYNVVLRIYGPEEVTASIVGLDEEQWIDETDEDLEISDISDK